MKASIFGCGAYGLALCDILINNGHDVKMWTKFKDEKDLLEKTRKNEKALGDYKISEKVTITTDAKECASYSDLIIIVIPSSFIEELIINIKDTIRGKHILIASKGLEQKNGLLLYDMVENHIYNKKIAVIGGPSFAKDVIKKKPIGLSVASNSRETIKVVKNYFENNYVKLTDTTDIIGVELCGVIKNVVALGSGMLNGLELPSSTKAMFLTKSLDDIGKLIEKLGGKEKTVVSYAGIGDLILTCTSEESRNFKYGKLVGQGSSRAEREKFLIENTVEGIHSLSSIVKLLKKKNIEVLLIEIMDNIFLKEGSPEKIFGYLEQ